MATNGSTSQKTIVVVGGVAGGATAAARARRENESAKIIIYEKGPYISFSNCGLPYYVGGVVGTRDKMFVANPAGLASRYNIDAKPSHEVTKINRDKKTVTVADLTQKSTFEQHYDKLILCPGAAAIVPPIPGAKSANVFTLKTVPDADAILAWMHHLPDAAGAGGKKPKAVVVGAGFIGMETAESLHGVGVDVTVVELLDQILPTFDKDMVTFVDAQARAKGLNLVLGDGVKTIETAKETVEGVEVQVAKTVVLNSGKKLQCDLIVMSIGVRPETELATAAGLAMSPSRGIVIDEFCRTSDSDIYACGDAAETFNLITGRRQRFALAGPANRMGRIAGSNAAASADYMKFPGAIGTSIVECMGVTAAQTGLTEKQCQRENVPYEVAIVHQNNHTGVYPGAQMMHIKILSDPATGRLLGAQVVGGAGTDKRCDVFATAIMGKMTVADMQDLDLAYSPQYGAAKDPVHMAAFTAQNQHTGFVDAASIADIVARAAKASPAELAQMQFLDVRGKDEWGRDGVPDVPGAVWVHVPVNGLRPLLSEANCPLDPAKETFILCHSGLRSYIAARMLKGRGFSGKLWNVTGGMMMVPAQLRRKEVTA